MVIGHLTTLHCKGVEVNLTVTYKQLSVSKTLYFIVQYTYCNLNTIVKQVLCNDIVEYIQCTVLQCKKVNANVIIMNKLMN